MLGARREVAPVAASLVGVARPTKLRIGFAVWRVRWLTEKAWRKRKPGGRDTSGLTWPGTLEVWIRDNDVSELALAEILLHEVLHACISAGSLEQALRLARPKDREEILVAGLAPILLAELEELGEKFVDVAERYDELEQVVGDQLILAARARSILNRQGPALPDGIPSEPVDAVPVECAEVNGCGEAEDPDRGPDHGLFSSVEYIAPPQSPPVLELRFTVADNVKAGETVVFNPLNGLLHLEA